MNLNKKFFLIIFVFLIPSLGPAKVLDVPQAYQEQSQWCWAGVSESVLEYYGEFYDQTKIAQYGTEGANIWNWLYGSSSNPTRRGVDLILTYFADISSIPSADDLPLSSLDDNINDDRPIIIRWGWDSGGGHIVVVMGVESSMIHIVDPWYGPSINTYDWVKNGSDHTWTHTLEMVDRPPILDVFPTELSFVAESNDNEILPKKLEITNSGERDFSWSVSTDVSWLSIQPESGYPPADVEVHVDPSGLSIGTHTAGVTIMAVNAQNSIAIIPLTLEIRGCINGLDEDTDVDGADIAVLARNFSTLGNEFEKIVASFGTVNCNNN